MLKLSIIFFSASLLLADDLSQISKGSSSEEASPQKVRNGRLFYVYTQKTTTTLITATNCYVTSTGLTACGRRKKRALINQEDLDVDIDLAPSVVYPDDEEEDLEKSVSGSLSDEEQNRENKALLYWLTTSSVATAYSYTQTFTIASLICSPSGYTVTECKSL